MPRYIIETYIDGEWQNAWLAMDEATSIPYHQVFESVDDALGELENHFSDMEDEGMKYSRDDYRIVPLDSS